MRVRQLNFSNCHLPRLDAATIRVDRVLRITGSRIPGVIRLGGTQIAGAFFLDNADLGHEPPDEAERDPILQLNHAIVNDDVWGPGLRVRGQVRMAGATVTGAVIMDDADLSEPDRIVLDAATLTVQPQCPATPRPRPHRVARSDHPRPAQPQRRLAVQPGRCGVARRQLHHR